MHFSNRAQDRGLLSVVFCLGIGHVRFSASDSGLLLGKCMDHVAYHMLLMLSNEKNALLHPFGPIGITPVKISS